MNVQYKNKHLQSKCLALYMPLYEVFYILRGSSMTKFRPGNSYQVGKLNSVSVERRAESGEQTLESGDLYLFGTILTTRMPIIVEIRVIFKVYN